MPAPKGNQYAKGHGYGRPTRYKKEYCERLIQHMSLGYTFTSFAGVLEINIDTLYEWEKKHKDFSEAKKVGKAVSLRAYERLVRETALGNIKGANATALVWFGKNVHGWTDKHETKISSDAPINITYELKDES